MAEQAKSLSGAQVALIVLGVALLAGGGYFVWFLMQDPPKKPVAETPSTPLPPSPPIKGPIAPDDPDVIPIKTTGVPTEPAATIPTGQQGVPTSLAGFVLDVEGKPVLGAVVQRFRYGWDDDATKRIVERFKDEVLEQKDTLADGRYEFSDLVPGEAYYLRAMAPGYVPIIKDNVKVGLLANFNLRRGSMVEGLVKDQSTGDPVPGALIRGFYRTASNVSDVNRLFRWSEIVRTDDHGKYRFEGVPGANVKFLLYHSEYEDLVEDHPVGLDKSNKIDFAMKKGLVIKGVVLNKLNDTPVANADVRIQKVIQPMTAVKTDAEGRFEVRGIERTMYAFVIVKDGFTMTRHTQQFTDADDYDDTKKNDLVIRMDPAGSARGIVLDPDGNPVVGARVFVAEKNPLNYKVRNAAETRTGIDGTFLVGNLNAGAATIYRMAAHKDGFGIGVSADISVAPEEIKDSVEVRLARGSNLRGVVRDEVQAPIAGAVITVETPPFMDVWFLGQDLGQASTQTLVTGDDGSYELAGIWRGSFTLSINHPDHVPLDKQRVVIKDPDEVVNRDFTMKIGRYLGGTVTISGGETPTGATVSAMRMWMDTAEGTATVEETGQFRLSGLVKGVYRIQARKPGYSSEMLFNVNSDTGNIQLMLEKQGEVMGSVLDATGSPMDEFSVTLIPEADRVTTPEMNKVNAKRGVSRTFADPGGRFHIDGIDAGKYRVSVSGAKHMVKTLDNLAVPPGGVGNVGTMQLERGSTISGVIVSPEGQPVSDAIVTAHNNELAESMRQRGEKPPEPEEGRGKVQTPTSGGEGDQGDGSAHARPGQVTWSGRPDASGKYVLSGLPEGTYMLRVQTSRYVPPPNDTLQLGKAQEVTRDFTLPLASTVILTITDDTGDAVVAASATVFDAVSGKKIDTQQPARSDARGTLRVYQLPPGSYRLRIVKSGFLVEEVPVELSSGATISKDLRLNKIR